MALVKELNKVKKSWNLCALFFESIINATYNVKIAFF
jgi:hypothetical protein